MKRTLIGKNVIAISSGAALCALFAIPAACSSDSNPITETEAGTGGTTGTGGHTGTGGGSAGKTSSGGAAGATGGTKGSGGTSAETGGAAAGGADSGVPDSSMQPDGSMPDATPDSAVMPACGAPADAAKAKLCLTWDPDMVTATADPRLDNKGTLIVQVFDPASATPAQPVYQIMYPPPTDAGLPVDMDLGSLPQLDIDGLPTTVLVRALFVDNPEWFLTDKTGLTYGMYIGGFDLTKGVLPPPDLKPITLEAGKGTLHSTHLTALRRFTTSVALAPGVTPGDDAQGPLSVGAFQAAAPAGLPVLGGAQLPCVDLSTRADGGVRSVDVTGFVYGTGDRWLVAQLDDFNQGGLAKPGDIVSLGAPLADGGVDFQSAADTQKITLTDQYSVTVPPISLGLVLPQFTGLTPYACP